MGPEREEVGQLADGREMDAPDELDRRPTAIGREVELDVLREAREVGDAQERGSIVSAQVREDPSILRVEELQACRGRRPDARAGRG